VDVVLPTQAVEPPRGSYAIAPRICQLAVLDALFNRVGPSNGNGPPRRCLEPPANLKH
jgi:DNA-binding MurR/RpiR family transcriptional regulator